MPTRKVKQNMIIDITPLYASVDEAELITGVSRWTWRAYAYKGKVESCKVGARLLIPIKEIRRILLESRKPRMDKNGNGLKLLENVEDTITETLKEYRETNKVTSRNGLRGITKNNINRSQLLTRILYKVAHINFSAPTFAADIQEIQELEKQYAECAE